MTMAPFYTRFPDLAWKEMRSVVVHDLPILPAGQYGFLELYCEDRDCDCRRTVINVVSPMDNSPIWATINYGWDSLDFYAKWLGDAQSAEQMQGATLDPLNPQTRYAATLLELFKLELADAAYVERLKRHYTLFKGSVQAPLKRAKMSSQKRPSKRR